MAYVYTTDGTGSTGHRSTGHQISNFGWVGSRVSVLDLVFDPVLNFNMCVYRGFVPTDYSVTPARQISELTYLHAECPWVGL